MDFLRDEFADLPDTLVASLLAQLEIAVRQSKYINSAEGHRLDLRCIQLCSTLKAILDTAAQFRSIRDQQNQEQT